MSEDTYLRAATRLAQLLGPDASPTELVGVVASHANEDGPLTPEIVVAETDSIDSATATSFLQFLLSNDFATAADRDGGVRIDASECFELLTTTRTAHRVLEESHSKRDSVTVEFVCTLPENDPSFAQLDPVDFDLGQITTRLLSLCREASEELVLTSPFLELEGMEWLLPGLEGALERGVDLTLVSRQLRDGQPNHVAVQELFDIAAGLPGDLEVYDYYEPGDDEYPAYTLHSKLLVADRRTAYVGSANFTKYGFAENLEIGVVVDAPAVRDLHSLVAHLVAERSTQIDG
jgi:phosphatidylserine/phosphatidylglycerophosphate/cardiolipin synthase-like enzyme